MWSLQEVGANNIRCYMRVCLISSALLVPTGKFYSFDEFAFVIVVFLNDESCYGKFRVMFIIFTHLGVKDNLLWILQLHFKVLDADIVT